VSYLVFARKYRPKTFEEVVGQEHVARTLTNALKTGRLAHAYLFSGPRGVGKTTMARILARVINCPDDDAEMAEAIYNGNDVDVIEIDAASNRKVEDVEPLVDSTRYLPQRAPRKIFIVDEAHMLSKHAWNALLKTLEEPPPHVLFIFATTEPHKVIETVRSRCQRFDFKRISPADIAGKLRRIAESEGARVSDGVFEEIARRATGGLRDAESLFDQALSSAPADRDLEVADLVAILGGIPCDLRTGLLDLAHSGEMAAVLEQGAGIVDAGADPAELLRDLYGDLRDIAIARARGEEGTPGVEWCLAGAQIVARHQRLATDSRATRATMDLALLSLARLGDVKDLEALAERLERLASGAPAPKAAPEPVPERPQLKASSPSKGPKLEARGEQEQNDPSAAPPTAASKALSSDELARIRGNPRVREVMDKFGGQIEEVRRTDG
jgi:DNA polymerase-3 subunit gamma/tau